MLRLLFTTMMLCLATPAMAAWQGYISDMDDIRQSKLAGVADGNPSERVVLLCTSASNIRPIISIAVFLPATGRYSVRQGDPATLTLTMGDQQWGFDLTVSANDSSEFGADADDVHVIEVVQALTEAPSRMKATLYAGPIDVSLSITSNGLESHATEWLDGCGF